MKKERETRIWEIFGRYRNSKTEKENEAIYFEKKSGDVVG